MSLTRPANAEPLYLTGTPYERGRAQAELNPALISDVRAAVEIRLQTMPLGETAAYVSDLHDYTARHYPEILEELDGLGAGFGIAPERLFTYLNASNISDITDGAAILHTDGCTAFATSEGRPAALVAKNRDYRPEHVALQKVFCHADPNWSDRRYLTVGSLGSPGCFSSGMNSDGLAIADTSSRVNTHAVGMIRYFLMSWLLANCGSVDEALNAIRSTVHAGSGLLVLGDRSGVVAAVELGPGRHVGIERFESGAAGRSNHFVLPLTMEYDMDTPQARLLSCSSVSRYEELGKSIPRQGASTDAVRKVLAQHASDGSGFCRHGGAEISTTISGSIYDTAALELLFASGNPCSASWSKYCLHRQPPSVQ